MASRLEMIVIATILREHGETGVQTHVNALRRHLASRGIRHCFVNHLSYARTLTLPIYAARRVIDPFSGGASVLWYRYWHYVFLRLALRGLLRVERRAVVYAQGMLEAKAALLERRHASQRVMLAAHFNGSDAADWIARGKISRGGWIHRHLDSLKYEVLPRLDGIVYLSQYMRKVVQREVPALRRVESIVLPNFAPSPSSNVVPPIRGDLINIGTLEPRKNQAFLLRVLAEAASRGHRYSLTLVGDGPDRHTLAMIASQLGVREQTRFLGYVKNASTLMPGHRVYVHSALAENLPLSLIEAQSYGLPILAGEVGGIPEIVVDGRHGRFWDLDDPEDGARKLIDVLENHDVYRRFASHASAQFAERFETGVVAALLVDFLLARKPAPSLDARPSVVGSTEPTTSSA